ncbi:MAG: ABC transporter ATP-binding protein, partial [Chloroflexi bacterium]|nr:ABC transporter ATP-binding protein [Chloroflexota bacterium]
MNRREFSLAEEYRYNRSEPMRWIVSHILRYPLFVPLSIVMAVLHNYCYGVTQVLIGRAFDLITQASWEVRALAALAALAVAANVAQSVTDIVRNFATEFLAQRMERDARDELYLSLLGKSQTFHGKQRIGDIMARATNDVRMLNYMISPGLMLIIDSLMATVVPTLMILQIKAELTLTPLLFVALFAATLADYNRRLSPVSIAGREQFGVMNAGLAEAISGIEVVKANAQEAQEKARFVQNARRFRGLFVKQGDIQALYLPMLAFSFALAGGFLHALLLWQGGEITLGQAVAFMGLLSTLRYPTSMSIFSFNQVQLGLASARRILELINTETELDENPSGVDQPIRGDVAFQEVSFSYNGDKPTLQGITFAAHQGETIAIVGQTGSGKTTLTRLINRIFDAEQGRVLVDGIDVRDWRLESLRSQISTIEQD